MKIVTVPRSVWICCVPLLGCECLAPMMSLHYLFSCWALLSVCFADSISKPPKVDETFPSQVLHVRKSIFAQILNPLSALWTKGKYTLYTDRRQSWDQTASLVTPSMWHLSHSGSYFPCINTISAIHIAHIFKNIRNLFHVTHRKIMVQFMSGKQKPKSQNKANQAEEYRLALRHTVFGRST